uniref:Uncharacterized protein n=1 Tax=Oryza rufipogon TaxID=4529 RepID=A0A0E0MR64_ORYRU
MHRVAMAAAAAGDGGDGRGRTLGAVIKEKDEELALFLEMRRREKERGAAAAAAAAEQLLLSGDRVDVARDGMLLVDQPPPRPQPPAEHKAAAYRMTGGFRRAPGGADDFLNSDGGDKNDYDWLLTPPGTPLFPSLEESKKSPVSQTGTPKTRPTALKSRLANHPDPPSRTTLPLRATSSNNLNSAATTRRPSSSGGHTSNSSRPSTPTGRPALTNTSKGQHLLQQGQQHLQEHLALLPGHQFLQVEHQHQLAGHPHLLQDHRYLLPGHPRHHPGPPYQHKASQYQGHQPQQDGLLPLPPNMVAWLHQFDLPQSPNQPLQCPKVLHRQKL